MIKMHKLETYHVCQGKKNAWKNSLLDEKQMCRNSAVIKSFFIILFNSNEVSILCELDSILIAPYSQTQSY